MNKIRKIYMPALAINFLCVVVFSSVFNIIKGNNSSGYHSFILQLLGYLAVAELIVYLIGKIEMKSYVTYYLTQFFSLYLIFIIVSYCCQWFQFNIGNLLTMTSVFIAVFSLTNYHFYKLFKEEAADINKLLEKKSRNDL